MKSAADHRTGDFPRFDIPTVALRGKERPKKNEVRKNCGDTFGDVLDLSWRNLCINTVAD